MTSLIKQFLTLYLLSLTYSSLAINNLDRNTESDWTNYFNNDSIEINYKYIECKYGNAFDQEYIVFQIINKLDIDISVVFVEKLWYDDVCINCEHYKDEHRKTIILHAKEEKTGECEKNNSLKIFSRFTNKIEDMPIIGVKKISSLTKFELDNIDIK